MNRYTFRPTSRKYREDRKMNSNKHIVVIPDICHKYHKLDMRRKICHVEKFQIYMHDRCGEIWNFSTFGVISNFSTWQMWRNLTFLHMLSNFKFLHMTDVEKSEVSPHLACVWCGECLNICTHYAVLLKNWFCRGLHHFVANSVLSRFTHFCVEKNLTKDYVCGEKVTNIRYEQQQLHYWQKE